MRQQEDQRLVVRPIGLELADRLEDAIIREAYAPGEKLGEAQICALFGVSRSPLREALQILENRGLVERRPRIGARVTTMSVEALDEITTCRIPLEGTCSRLLAERPEHAEIADALDAQLTAMQEAHAGNDSERAFDANARMTALLHENCGNDVLAKLLGQLDRPALRYRYRAYRRATGLVGDMIESNRAMIAEIRLGCGDAAEAVTRELVEQAWKTTRALFLAGDETM